MNLFGKSIGAWAKAIAVTTIVVYIGFTLTQRFAPQFMNKMYDGRFPWEG